MDKLRIDGRVIAQLKQLVKLLDTPQRGLGAPVPTWMPDGTKARTIDDISVLMGVDHEVAALFVYQFHNSEPELKSMAAEVLGLYVPADDAHQLTEVKAIKLVRTVGGIRRYSQPKGSIIIRDGEAPLDGITAAPNDLKGYEKLVDKAGNFYYIGQEGQGRYVVRNPVDNSAMHVTTDEEDAFSWLNKQVGGGKEKPGTERNVFDASPNKKPTDDEQREQVRESLATGLGEDKYKLNVAEAAAVDTLDDDGIAAYKRGRDRGLSHRDAYSAAHKPGASGAPQAQNPKKKPAAPAKRSKR